MLLPCPLLVGRAAIADVMRTVELSLVASVVRAAGGVRTLVTLFLIRSGSQSSSVESQRCGCSVGSGEELERSARKMRGLRGLLPLPSQSLIPLVVKGYSLHPSGSVVGGGLAPVMRSLVNFPSKATVSNSWLPPWPPGGHPGANLWPI